MIWERVCFRSDHGPLVAYLSLRVSVALTVSVAGSTPSNAQCAVRGWTTRPLHPPYIRMPKRRPTAGARSHACAQRLALIGAFVRDLRQTTTETVAVQLLSSTAR